MNIFFDYDGTLHDTEHVYGEAVRAVYAKLRSLGYGEDRALSDAYVSRYLGMTIEDMWADFMPGIPEDIRRMGSELVGSELHEGVLRGVSRLYPDTRGALDELKARGHRLYVLTNGSSEYLAVHRKVFGLDRWFTDYLCASDTPGMHKSELFGVYRQTLEGDCCVIGDRYSDIEVGTKNGIPAVACTWGFGSESEFVNADYVVNDYEELLELEMLK